MDVRFGATIIQSVPFPLLRDDFHFAESIGLDNAWVIDQFGIDGVPEIPLLEAWATLAALACETDSIRIGSMVTNGALRNPALLAKSILTVDQISAGRVVTAVGAGYYEPEHATLGIDFLDGIGRSDRLGEVVSILDRALRGDTVDFRGAHFQISDAVFRPVPIQLPRPELWVAAQGPRSLRTGVLHAEAIVCLGEYDRPIEESLPAFRRRMAKIDELCDELGRDPKTLRRCYYAGWANEPIFASVDETADLIGRYVEAGATDFTFYLHNPATPVLDEIVGSHRAASRDQFARAATEVFPGFRSV